MWTRRNFTGRHVSRRQTGVTLVELILAMVIVGVATAGMIAAFNTTSKASADPIVFKQLAAVAEGIMEEIQLKPFDVAPNVAASGRDAFTDVRDFDCYGLTNNCTVPIVGIVDVSNNKIPGLSGYSVAVRVEAVSLTDVPATGALRITVTVSNGANNFVLTGWRLDYA